MTSTSWKAILAIRSTSLPSTNQGTQDRGRALLAEPALPAQLTGKGLNAHWSQFRRAYFKGFAPLGTWQSKPFRTMAMVL